MEMVYNNKIPRYHDIMTGQNGLVASVGFFIFYIFYNLSFSGMRHDLFLLHQASPLLSFPSSALSGGWLIVDHGRYQRMRYIVS